MEYTKKLIAFIFIITILLLSFSVFIHAFHIQTKPLINVSILSDIIKEPKQPQPNIHPNDSIQVTTNIVSGRVFIPFSSPNRFTEYRKDTSLVVMRDFVKKLVELKKGKRNKIRIAFLGDSMIEGDYVSETLRKLLQQKFGGNGVGFLPFENKFNEQRTSAIIKANNFSEINFKNNSAKLNLFLSGRNFAAQNNASAEFRDNTFSNTTRVDKYLLYGTMNGNEFVTVNVNGKNVTITSSNMFNQLAVDSSSNNSLQLQTSGANNLYGISFESPTGVVVDNFSFRGVSGYEFFKFDSAFLSAIAKTRQYDLVIFEYGVNLIEKPADINFNWYYKPFIKSILRLKNSFPQTNFMLMGCSDRAFRYDNEYKTATGLSNVIDLQQKIAFETSCAFYNTFISMGGDGTMAKWVDSKPPLAYKDYVHPNAKGSEIIGTGIYNAIMYEYNKQLSKK